MGVRVRPARREDLRAVQRLVSDSWRVAYGDLLPPDALAFIADEERFQPLESLEYALESDDLHFLVALVDGEVVGEGQFATGPETHAFVSPEDDEIQLQSLYVAPNHWRTGVGSRLVEAGFDIVRDDADAVLVEALAKNDDARRFYRSMGFEKTGDRVISLFGLPYRATIMRRPFRTA